MEHVSKDEAAFSMLRDGWVPLLAAVVLFLVHDRLTGVPSGGAPAGGVAGAAILAGHALFRSFPDLPLVAKYAALTGITMLLAIPAIMLLGALFLWIADRYGRGVRDLRAARVRDAVVIGGASLLFATSLWQLASNRLAASYSRSHESDGAASDPTRRSSPARA